MSKENFETSIVKLNQVNSIEQMFSGKSNEEIIDGHFIELRNGLVELNKFFRMNIDFENLNNAQLIVAYRAMYEYYVNIAQPFDSQELKLAIANVTTAEIMYEANLGYVEVQEQSQKIIEARMRKSIEIQRKHWDNKGGTSLMFAELTHTKHND